MSLQGDLPPVTVVEPLDIGMPRLDRAQVSVFRNKYQETRSSIHAHLSSDRQCFELVLVFSHLSPRENEAIAAASKQVWLDRPSEKTKVKPGFGFVKGHIESLTNLLSNLSLDGSLSFHYSSIAIDWKSDSIEIASTAPSGILVVDRRLLRASHDNSQSETPQKKQELPAAVVLAPRASGQILRSSVNMVLEVPYPRSGAAELTHFALAESGVDSDVIWVDFD